LEFFRAGIEHRERCFLAANRVGKTEGVGGYELTCHLTGEYRDWWEGRTFDHPIEAWAAGDTSQTVRDIIQAKLLGPVGSFGTGLVRKALIVRTTSRQGIPDAVQDIYVKHKTGGTSSRTNGNGGAGLAKSPRRANLNSREQRVVVAHASVTLSVSE
jgi:hypothetical protein